MADKIRWGIIGCGNIAHKFAEGLRALEDAELLAVGSRTQENAEAFGAAFNVPLRYGSYEALANDPDLDAVYIGTPHPMHKPNSILCLRAGKAVLCEKPFTVNRAEAEEVIRVAREEKRFLMEAMWTRFLPIIRQVREWLTEGRIGEPRMIQADFGFRAGYDEESRLFNPRFAGGSLLDVGVYCVSMASMVFGAPPREISGLAHLGPTGVDEQAAWVLGYSGGRLAVLSSAVRTNSPHEVTLLGTEGMIRVHPMFWCGTRATLTVQEHPPIDVELPLQGNGYNYEAAAVGQCLREGALECETMPLSETLEIMDTMDRLRAQWGLKYPME